MTGTFDKIVIRTRDVATACCVGGGGPPVLFIHGYTLTGLMWRPTIDLIARRYRCIAPDLRGHGGSQATETATIADLADDLAFLLDGLGERRRVVLVGLSLGGIVAFEFFRRHRSKLAALVLCNTRTNAETPASKERWAKFLDDIRVRGSRAVAEAFIDYCFAQMTSPALRDDWFEIMASQPPQGMIATAHALAFRRSAADLLPNIDLPTLVVAGEHDRATPVETLREIHSAVPGAKWALIDGVGHIPPLESPPAFARVLLDFLDGLPYRGPVR